METRILLPEEWGLVAPIVTGEFENAMPQTPQQATFLAAMDGERLAGFIHIETLFNLNSIYVLPGYRRTRLPWQMMSDIDARLTRMKGFSAIAFPDARSHIKMYRRFGGRELDASLGVWRKDY